MKKILSAGVAAAAMSMFIGSAQAADYEQAIHGLVVSGVVEKWVGYTFLGDDNGNFEPDESGFFTSGNSARLSLPLGSNLSIQMDGDLEYTSEAFDSNDNADVFQSAFQFGGHLTYRDPSSFALGGFAGVGGGKSENDAVQGWIVGGEAQIYLNDITLYAQAGAFDGEVRNGDPDDAFRDGWFARGVARWYMTPTSRLQGEFIYADGKQDEAGDTAQDMEVLQWGARYDTVLPLPLIGNSQVFLGYRGTHAENFGDPGDNGEFTDHTVMVGAVYSFGGATMMETERHGAGLDLPNVMRWVTFGEILD